MLYRLGIAIKFSALHAIEILTEQLHAVETPERVLVLHAPAPDLSLRVAQTLGLPRERDGIVGFLEYLRRVLGYDVSEEFVRVPAHDPRYDGRDRAHVRHALGALPEHHLAHDAILDRADRGKHLPAREGDRPRVGPRVT